jgi:AcrR family transcriptional regulator
MVDSARSRPGGRTARTRTAVLDACVAELADRGYAGTSVDAVAARAGINKATIYRRWGGKDGLLADAVETFATHQAHPEALPDTGDVDEDLRLWARSVLATLTGPTSAPVIRALFGAAGDSPAVRDLRRRFWRVRSALVIPVVERAVDRGQLPPGTDPEDVVKHVGAPLYYRFLVLDEPLTPHAADQAAATAAAAAHAGVYRSGDPTD